ncbi:TetR/AcrR family transcriptional regulator [Streptomyces sp. NPDC020875]|uniref:TetR/AcrR family transcriptional regulator n=1 Tax=Streptomyces sp. NPDC020875 TaxID=3154898 RepID=UPI0033D81F61
MASAADGGRRSDRTGRSGKATGGGAGRPVGGRKPKAADHTHTGSGSGSAAGTGQAEAAPGDGAPEATLRASVWQNGGRADRARPRRSAQPAALDRARIVAAAVRLLDAEGAAKFSMRRLAAELDVTAMSVYWYVDNKEDLLEYALDAVYGELPLPDVSDPARWREQLRALAAAYRTLLVRHPWTSALVGQFLNIGPNSVSFVLAAQQAVRNAGLPLEGQIAGMAAVFQFVYGFGTIEGQFIARCTAAGISEDVFLSQAMSTVNEMPELGEYISSSNEMLEARGGDTVQEMRDRDFDFALELMLAGMERMAERPEPEAGRRESAADEPMPPTPDT